MKILNSEKLKNNINTIKIYNSALAENINNTQLLNCEILEAKKEGYTLKYKGKLLHSLYAPIKESLKQIENINLLKKELIIAIGIGAGYHIEALIKKESCNKIIIVFEPNIEVLKAACMINDFNDKRICFINNEQGLKNAIRSHFKLAYRFDIISLNSFHRIWPTEHLKIYSIIKNELNLMSTWHLTTAKTAETHFINTVSQLINNKRLNLMSSITGAFFNIPAIIIGAGPSIDKNFNLLKQIKNRALLISSDSMLPKLYKHGLTPHFTVIGDANPLNYTFFKQIKNHEQLNLLMTMNIFPKVAEFSFNNKYVFMSGSDPLVETLIGKENLNFNQILSSGNVTTAAFFISTAIFGCNPVIICGQDCAYSDGKTYAKGTYAEEIEYTINEDGKAFEKTTAQSDGKMINSMTTKGLFGTKLLTVSNLVAYKHWFSETAVLLKQQRKDIVFINSTEGGAFIDGMEHKRLREVFFKYCTLELDFNSILKNKNKINKNLIKPKVYIPILKSIFTLCQNTKSKISTYNIDELDIVIDNLTLNSFFSYYLSKPLRTYLLSKRDIKDKIKFKNSSLKQLNNYTDILKKII